MQSINQDAYVLLVFISVDTIQHSLLFKLYV